MQVLNILLYMPFLKKTGKDQKLYQEHKEFRLEKTILETFDGFRELREKEKEVRYHHLASFFDAFYGTYTRDTFFIWVKIHPTPQAGWRPSNLTNQPSLRSASRRFLNTHRAQVETCHEIKDFGLGLQPAPTLGLNRIFLF